MITLRIKVPDYPEKTHVVQLTKFPDNTIQLWNLPPEYLATNHLDIIWHYESSDEIVAIFQLSSLIGKHKISAAKLIVPFFPFSRQDKNIQNDTTFGLHTILFLLARTANFRSIVTYDIHNPVPFLNYSTFELMDVNSQVKQALELSKADLVCFPDKGATTRGYDLQGIPSFHLSKTRDQQTGKITGMKCDLPLNLEGKTILLVDDICDGGRTFKEAAKVLHEMGAKDVDLYVTHGIFSNGVHTLAELRNIYTTDSYKTKANLTIKVTVLPLEI